ncbi:MAG: hypothetical protein OT477_22495 [Chloroflexi bacterium]|nr:hypothetical protein [Chloroflexota bacterium]
MQKGKLYMPACFRAFSPLREFHGGGGTIPASPTYEPSHHNKIVSFLWGIANDILRNLFK